MNQVMSTSNNLLHRKLMKRNVPNKRKGCLNPVGRWLGTTMGWAYKTLQPPFSLWSKLLVAVTDDHLQLKYGIKYSKQKFNFPQYVEVMNFQIHTVSSFAWNMIQINKCLWIQFLHNYCRNVNKQNVRLGQRFLNNARLIFQT